MIDIYEHNSMGKFITDNKMDLKLTIEELFDDDSYRVKDRDFENTVCFDIGANIGVFTRLFKKLYPGSKVFAFEPVKSTHQMFLENTKFLTGVSSYNVGIGFEPGSFNVHSNGSSLYSTVGKESFARTESNVKASLMGIKEFHSKYIGIFEGGNAVLKCDAEGGEECLFFSDEGVDILKKSRFSTFELHFLSDEMPSYQDYKEKINSLFGSRATIYRRSKYGAHCTINNL